MDDLALLPEEVREAVGEMNALPKAFPEIALKRPVFMEGLMSRWGLLQTELLRLARELSAARGIAELMAQKAKHAEAELATARETIKRLNRRVQVAEAGIAEKVKESGGRNLGRALANAAFDMMQDERDEALAELAAVKRMLWLVIRHVGGEVTISPKAIVEYGKANAALARSDRPDGSAVLVAIEGGAR